MRPPCLYTVHTTVLFCFLFRPFLHKKKRLLCCLFSGRVFCLRGRDQVGDPTTVDFSCKEYSGALIQYPNTYGDVNNPEEFVKKAHEVNVPYSHRLHNTAGWRG